MKRRRILPTFETLCESTESESDDSKKSSPDRPRPALGQPGPVDIGESVLGSIILCAVVSGGSARQIYSSILLQRA
jgi:hypothetical protein